MDLKKGFCINIKNRIIRWERTKKEISKLPQIQIERIDAIECHPPRKGLIQTFMNIVKNNRDEDHILIIEDDIWIISPDKINSALNNVPNDWDILLGGVYFLKDKSIVNQDWMSVSSFCSTHFTIVRSTIYENIMNFPLDSPYPLDRLLSDLNKKIYVMHPMPCRQYGGYSDIRKKYVDYNDRDLPFMSI